MDQLITGGIEEIFGVSQKNGWTKVAIIMVLVMISFVLLMLLYKFPPSSAMGTVFAVLAAAAVFLIQAYIIIQSSQL